MMFFFKVFKPFCALCVKWAASVESVLHPAVSTDMGDPCTMKSNGAFGLIKKSETDRISPIREWR